MDFRSLKPNTADTVVGKWYLWFKLSPSLWTVFNPRIANDTENHAPNSSRFGQIRMGDYFMFGAALFSARLHLYYILLMKMLVILHSPSGTLWSVNRALYPSVQQVTHRMPLGFTVKSTILGDIRNVQAWPQKCLLTLLSTPVLGSKRTDFALLSRQASTKPYVQSKYRKHAL